MASVHLLRKLFVCDSDPCWLYPVARSAGNPSRLCFHWLYSRLICRLMSSQRCLMGLQSGDLACHSMRSTPLSSKNWFVIWAQCGRSIIVHEDEILANGSCVWNHTWLQYLIKVPLGYPPGMGTRSVYSLVLIPIPTSWHFYIGRVPHLVDSLRWVFLPTLLQTPTLLSGKTCTRQRRLKRTLLPNAVRSIGDVDL